MSLLRITSKNSSVFLMSYFFDDLVLDLKGLLLSKFNFIPFSFLPGTCLLLLPAARVARNTFNQRLYFWIQNKNDWCTTVIPTRLEKKNDPRKKDKKRPKNQIVVLKF